MRTIEKSSQISPASLDYEEINRLISAAVVNRKFCDLLLSNPDQALTGGYRGENFDLSPEEQAFICSIQATSLTDLAGQLLNGHGKNGRNGSNGHNGHNGYHHGRNGHNGYHNGSGKNGSR